ncbi:pyridoxamine 5'-phosphate oxidase family protein [Niabella drilacis]|uniref:Pyridoxamine 5'-phosphate oxidase n=1 Tax=Niabella drilacis (strain DSM 25811 / CCM 8410 / CCUG 62505 / LMG 26954 / E90) TaxID=1285928 RepID=A0A1G7A6H8_NIADE|nr:pyridoxamine 5'-phosphate oxidase family protein [Niabella drilacis]SDE10390.1 Pyridoxamine 5'-phosphate oxidase [Niabella drilacis]
MNNNLTESEADAVLQHNITGHLGCCSDGVPYIVPLCYAYDGTAIYGRTYEGLKLRILRSNPNVCFQVEEIKDMITWKSVICQGVFKELTGAEERNRALLVLQQRVTAMVSSEALRLSQYWPFSLKEMDEVKGILFHITINSKTGRYHYKNLELPEDLFG